MRPARPWSLTGQEMCRRLAGLPAGARGGRVVFLFGGGGQSVLGRRPPTPTPAALASSPTTSLPHSLPLPLLALPVYSQDSWEGSLPPPAVLPTSRPTWKQGTAILCNRLFIKVINLNNLNSFTR